jgi:hypothetical protein
MTARPYEARIVWIGERVSSAVLTIENQVSGQPQCLAPMGCDRWRINWDTNVEGIRHQMLCGVESPASNELFRTSDFTAGFKLDQPNSSRNSKAEKSRNEFSFLISAGSCDICSRVLLPRSQTINARIVARTDLPLFPRL